MKHITALGLVLVTTACATVMPPEDLVTARTTYNRATQGPTAQLDPADLHSAKESLDSAEKSFAADGDTQATRDFAYVAERRTEIAESRGRTVQTERERNGVVTQMNADQTSTVRNTSAALGRANQQLAAQGQELAGERQRREDAERRAARATADLARIATVKQEPRGMVITLSGSVLFASGHAELLADAQVKLLDVAKALTEQDPDSKIVVEGHTDSQGAAAFNQDLSQKRADAVRSFLVSHGIAADRVTAQGFGPSRSVSDNGTIEGRANNRRVEIVVSNGQHAQR